MLLDTFEHLREAAPLVTALLAACPGLTELVRPILIITDADLADGRAVALIRAWRAIPTLEEVHVVVLERVTPDEGHDLAGDPYVDVRQGSDNDAISGLLEQLRAA